MSYSCCTPFWVCTSKIEQLYCKRSKKNENWECHDILQGQKWRVKMAVKWYSAVFQNLCCEGHPSVWSSGIISEPVWSGFSLSHCRGEPGSPRESIKPQNLQLQREIGKPVCLLYWVNQVTFNTIQESIHLMVNLLEFIATIWPQKHTQLCNYCVLYTVLGKVTFKINALQYCVAHLKTKWSCYLVPFLGK